MPGWPNYVALGDSLTGGRDDHDSEGGRIGWARRLAGILSTRTGVPCALTNLAADGASVADVPGTGSIPTRAATRSWPPPARACCWPADPCRLACADWLVLAGSC
jgi:hypothetical protein